MAKSKAKNKSVKRFVAVILRRAAMFYGKPENEDALQKRSEEMREAVQVFQRYLLFTNSGALVATLALMGQIHAPLRKAGQMDKASIGALFFLLAIVFIGFGLMANIQGRMARLAMLSTAAFHSAKFFFSSFILSFFFFMWGSACVLTALLTTF